MSGEDWRVIRNYVSGFFALTAVCLVSFHIGDYFMAMAERGGGGDFGALVTGLLGSLVFKFLSIPSFFYILVVGVFFPFSWDWGWLVHAGICGTIAALLFLPEGSRALPKMLDALAAAYGYVTALVSPTAKKLRPQKSDEELAQEAETKDLSTQLQDKLTQIERTKARIRERQKNKE